MSRDFKCSRLEKIFTIFLIMLCVLVLRIGYFSIYKSDDYKKRIERQSTEKVALNSGRGIIYDRNNLRLTDIESQNIIVVPKYVLSESYKNIEIIKKNTDLDEDDILEAIQKQIDSELIEFEVGELDDKNIDNLNKLNIILSKKTSRYTDDNPLINTIGYINNSEKRGMCGIEKSMDLELEDSNEEYISVFKPGQLGVKNGLELAKGSLEKIKNSSQNLKLTIDLKIQKKIESIVNTEKNPSVVVVSDVKTGEILAITSRPTFNPNKIIDYLDSREGALQNRAFSATYPAGSVFKIAVLFAALENKAIDFKEYSYNCTGNQIINSNEKLNCNNLDGHGVQNLGECFANSCNTAFYDIAKRVGKEAIFKAIKTLHLDKKVDIAIDEEIDSKIPDDISLSNLSIGQGALEFTPLQINQMTQIIANDGFYKHLYIYDSFIDSSFNIIKKIEYSYEDEIISPYIVSQIKKYMIDVADYGTAKVLNSLEGGCGVKTGTAQSSRDNVDVSHGWVTGFYPRENPKYAITALIEGTKENSKSAIPLFEQICRILK